MLVLRGSLPSRNISQHALLGLENQGDTIEGKIQCLHGPRCRSNGTILHGSQQFDGLEMRVRQLCLERDN